MAEERSKSSDPNFEILVLPLPVRGRDYDGNCRVCGIMSALLLPRRGFILGLTSLLAAPAIVRASSLMPVRAERNYTGIDMSTGKDSTVITKYFFANNKWWKVNHEIHDSIHIAPCDKLMLGLGHEGDFRTFVNGKEINFNNLFSKWAKSA